MKIYKKSVLLFLCLMGVQLVVLSKSTIAQSYSQIKFDQKRVPWTQLSYRINKFSVEVNARVHLASLPAAEVEAVLIKSPQGDPIEVLTPQSNRISVYYDVDPIFLDPVKTINQVWFNPKDATALGRIRQRRGNHMRGFKTRYKTILECLSAEDISRRKAAIEQGVVGMAMQFGIHLVGTSSVVCTSYRSRDPRRLYTVSHLRV